MAQLIFLLLAIVASAKPVARKVSSESNLKVEFLKAIEIPAKKELKKTRIGGISGIVFDAESSTIWGVSDDRGKFGAPRVYKWHLTKDLTLELQDVVFIKDKGKIRPVFDFESMSMLPWGNFLLNSEGDDRARPARLPRLVEAKPTGEYVRDWPLPETYLPGKTGADPRGLRTNFGFEAMGMSADGKSWVMGSESWLAQDSDNISRLLKYDMKEAWILQPGDEWIYKLNYEAGLINGLTDLQNWKEDRWIFLERTAHLDGNSIDTVCQILEARVNGKEPIKGRQIFDFEKTKIAGINLKENYEAMAFGPEHPKGRILIVVNDNNFMNLPTQFLFFTVKEETAQ